MRHEKFKLRKCEYEHIKSTLNREPSDFELHLFSATYCEHCAYKHSKELLRLLPREGAKFYDENAGGFEIGEHFISFKMESHNHPCAVEPFNGAATGVGGIIRDVLAMNARPIALCNSLKFGKNRKYQKGVVEGISNYGNSIGVPTVSTEILLDDCFEENPLCNVTAIGIAKNEDVLTSNTAKVGQKLVLVGADTMRDGMGGASFASKKLSDEKAEDKIAIQIANPFLKKKLIEACLEIFEKKLVVSCQDCGAAGLLSSTSEVAFKSDVGVDIDLDKVHIADNLIKDFEIMLSETQERMLFVVEESAISEIEIILKKFELGYSIIGDTIPEKKYLIRKDESVIADLPVDLLVSPPSVELDFSPLEQQKKIDFETVDGNCTEIYEQYDHTVGARTCYQPTISLREEDLECSNYINVRSNVKYSSPNFNALWLYEENCYLGVYTFSSVIDENPFETVYSSIKNAGEFLISNGFEPKGITNCLNFANPEISPVMYEFRETINAIKRACDELKIPVCSGNVSFYNEHGGGRIKNTPTFTMLGVKKIL